MLAFWYTFSASGFVMAMTMVKSAPSAAVVNHLCPLITYSSPSKTAMVDIWMGLLPACSGSVIEKQERISPRCNGFKKVSFKNGEANWCINSMFPISGALQLKI